MNCKLRECKDKECTTGDNKRIKASYDYQSCY